MECYPPRIEYHCTYSLSSFLLPPEKLRVVPDLGMVAQLTCDEARHLHSAVLPTSMLLIVSDRLRIEVGCEVIES